MVKDIHDISQYFPDYEVGQLPCRQHLFAILSTIKGNVIEEFVRQARSNWSIKVDEEKKNFIEVEPLLLQKIEEVCHQKCKYKMLINKISNQRKSNIPIEKFYKICEEEKTPKGVWIGFISIWKEKRCK